MEDEYYIIQLRYPDAIFSYNTAFHIMNMTNLTPSTIDVTTLRKNQIIGNYNIHYVSKEKYNMINNVIFKTDIFSLFIRFYPSFGSILFIRYLTRNVIGIVINVITRPNAA